MDRKLLDLGFEADIGRNTRGRKALKPDPASAVGEAAWPASLSSLSSLNQPVSRTGLPTSALPQSGP